MWPGAIKPSFFPPKVSSYLAHFYTIQFVFLPNIWSTDIAKFGVQFFVATTFARLSPVCAACFSSMSLRILGGRASWVKAMFHWPWVHECPMVRAKIRLVGPEITTSSRVGIVGDLKVQLWYPRKLMKWTDLPDHKQGFLLEDLVSGLTPRFLQAHLVRCLIFFSSHFWDIISLTWCLACPHLCLGWYGNVSKWLATQIGSGWWFWTSILFFHSVGNFIIPNDFGPSFFRGVE